MSRVSWLGALLGLCGCGWFKGPEHCTISSTSCDGDAVRICVPDPSSHTADGTPATKWKVVMQCPPDPVLGPQTCSVVSGNATCVPSAADSVGATAANFSKGRYLRVHVEDGLIQRVDGMALEARPMSRGTGRWALVARADDIAKDAALVSEGEDAWVWAEGVTRVELIHVDGTVRSTRELGANKSRGEGLGVREQALSEEFPPTVRLLGPRNRVGIPPEVSAALGGPVTVVEPSEADLSTLADVLSRVTATASSAVGQVAFVEGGGLRDVGAQYERRVLWVDASPTRPGQDSSRGRAALARDVIRAVGRAVVSVSAVGQPGAQHPDDFPKEVASLLQARTLPLLSPGEDVAGTWGTLHGAIAEAGLAKPYSPALTSSKDTHQATADGFVSPAGSAGASEDFADTLAALAVPEAYSVSPCAGFDGRPFEQLEPRKLAVFVKLLAVFGLGLVDRATFAACTGDVEDRLTAPGILVRKSSGETVRFPSETQALRGPYYSNATRWAATASREGGEEIALLQLVYRGSVPELTRLRTVAGLGSSGARQRQSGSLSLASPTEGEVLAASGGLLWVRSATRERFEGLILGAVMGSRGRAASMLPLVLFRFDAPLWQDGQN